MSASSPISSLAQRDQSARESAVELAERRTLHRVRARIDQIADRLGLENVELAVEHRSAGEFSRQRLSGARTR